MRKLFRLPSGRTVNVDPQRVMTADWTANDEYTVSYFPVEHGSTQTENTFKGDDAKAIDAYFALNATSLTEIKQQIKSFDHDRAVANLDAIDAPLMGQRSDLVGDYDEERFEQ